MGTVVPFKRKGRTSRPALSRTSASTQWLLETPRVGLPVVTLGNGRKIASVTVVRTVHPSQRP